MDIPLSKIKPIYPPTQIPSPDNAHTDTPATETLIKTLHLHPHPEGGYYTETDRSPLRIANPYYKNSGCISAAHESTLRKDVNVADIRNDPVHDHSSSNCSDGEDATRVASSSILYLLTPGSPVGAFHRNRSRTVHTLHRGRGRYVVLRADLVDADANGKAPVESFVVGLGFEKGERVQWVVEGGTYKASYLLPGEEVELDGPGDEDGDGDRTGSGGLLISETVVPGFEAADHEFLTLEKMKRLLTEQQVEELRWLLRD